MARLRSWRTRSRVRLDEALHGFLVTLTSGAEQARFIVTGEWSEVFYLMPVQLQWQIEVAGGTAAQ